MVKSKKKFSTIALSSSFQDERIISIAKQCLEVLENIGVNILIDSSLSKLKGKSLSMSSEGQILKEADLLVAIGGDGTMLNCSRKFGSKGVPVLGINLGNLGFLTDIRPEILTSSLLSVVKGNYIEDKRFFLEAKIKNKSKKLLALNEIVIHSGSIAQLIEYELFIDNSFVYSQKADGLIISSPTGSTAYSLSGGGSIIHPKVNAFILLPMFPQSLSSSSLIINSESIIRVKILSTSKKTHVSLDSQENFLLTGKKEIFIKMAKSSLLLIHPKDHDFFSSCRNKLGWSNTPSNL